MTDIGVKIATGFAMLCLCAVPLHAENTVAWSDIRSTLFGTTAISEEDGTLSLDAPERAEDASLVPITIALAPNANDKIEKITLIVDENPAPVAATFTLGAASGSGKRQISTRLRVDRYTFIRAVAETADGKLHMTSKFVKASGGCSAPASKDADEALTDLGKMQIKTAAHAKEASTASEAQVMIRHPNFTGMQMDPVSRAYTPARFVEELEIRRAGELVLKMEGGISISENPNFRFTYMPKDNAPLEATARDTEGVTFTATSHQNGS